MSSPGTFFPERQKGDEDGDETYCNTPCIAQSYWYIINSSIDPFEISWKVIPAVMH